MQRWIFICAGLVALAAVSKAALKKKRVERGVEPEKAEEPALAQKPANRALRTLGILLAVLLFCSSLGLGGRGGDLRSHFRDLCPCDHGGGRGL